MMVFASALPELNHLSNTSSLQLILPLVAPVGASIPFRTFLQSE